jgi:hypothetical protein
MLLGKWTTIINNCEHTHAATAKNRSYSCAAAATATMQTLLQQQQQVFFLHE